MVVFFFFFSFYLMGEERGGGSGISQLERRRLEMDRVFSRKERPRI